MIFMLCLPSRWIVGVECDGESQVSAGSERGQHRQHPSLHLLDFVSSTTFLLSVLSPPAQLFLQVPSNSANKGKPLTLGKLREFEHWFAN